MSKKNEKKRIRVDMRLPKGLVGWGKKRAEKEGIPFTRLVEVSLQMYKTLSETKHAA